MADSHEDTPGQRPDELPPGDNFFDQDVLRDPIMHAVAYMLEQGVAEDLVDANRKVALVTVFEDLGFLLDTIAAKRVQSVRRDGEGAVLAFPGDFLPERRRRPYNSAEGKEALRIGLGTTVNALDSIANRPGADWATYVVEERTRIRYESNGRFIAPEAGEKPSALPLTYRVWSRRVPPAGPQAL